jgi:hypothetical protein
VLIPEFAGRCGAAQAMRENTVEEHSGLLAGLDPLDKLLNQDSVELLASTRSREGIGLPAAPHALNTEAAGADEGLDDAFVDP